MSNLSNLKPKIVVLRLGPRARLPVFWTEREDSTYVFNFYFVRSQFQSRVWLVRYNSLLKVNQELKL